MSRDPFNCGYCTFVGTPNYVQKFSARVQVPESDVPGRSSSRKNLRTICVRVKRKSTSKIITETLGRDVPLRKASERIPPSCMNTRISLSSARMSYTEISPDANPIPTTSIAGDWTRQVIAGLEVEVAEPVRRFEAGYLWIQILENDKGQNLQNTR